MRGEAGFSCKCRLIGKMEGVGGGGGGGGGGVSK